MRGDDEFSSSDLGSGSKAEHSAARRFKAAALAVKAAKRLETRASNRSPVKFRTVRSVKKIGSTIRKLMLLRGGGKGTRKATSAIRLPEGIVRRLGEVYIGNVQKFGSLPSKHVLDELGRVARGGGGRNKDRTRIKMVLSACDLTDVDVSALCHALVEIPIIAEIDVRSNRVSDAGMIEILKTMEEHLKCARNVWAAGEQGAMCLAHVRVEQNGVSSSLLEKLVSLESECTKENVRLEATWVFSKFLGEQMRTGILSVIPFADSCIVRFPLFQSALSEMLDRATSPATARKLLGEFLLYELDVQGIEGRVIGKMGGAVRGVSLSTFVEMCSQELFVEEVLKREASKHRKEIVRHQFMSAPWDTRRELDADTSSRFVAAATAGAAMPQDSESKTNAMLVSNDSDDRLHLDVVDGESGAKLPPPNDEHDDTALRESSREPQNETQEESNHMRAGSGTRSRRASSGLLIDMDVWSKHGRDKFLNKVARIKDHKMENAGPADAAAPKDDSALLEEGGSANEEGKATNEAAQHAPMPRSPPPSASRPCIVDEDVHRKLHPGDGALHLDGKGLALREGRLVDASGNTCALAPRADGEPLSSIHLGSNRLSESDAGDSLWRQANRKHLAHTTALNLSVNGLACLDLIEPAAAVPNLEILILSSNALTSTSTLKLCAFQSLQVLDLSHNRLKRVCGMEALHRLRDLDISNNEICAFTDMRALSLNQALERLWLFGNPVEKKSGYRARLITQLPFLKNLDGKLMPPSGPQRQRAKMKARELKAARDVSTPPNGLAASTPKRSFKGPSSKSPRGNVNMVSERLYSPSPTRVTLSFEDLMLEKQPHAASSKKVSPHVWDRLANRLAVPKSSRQKHTSPRGNYGFGSKPPPPHFRPSSALYGSKPQDSRQENSVANPTLYTGDRRVFRSFHASRSSPRTRDTSASRKLDSRQVSPSLLVHTASSIQKTLTGGQEADDNKTRRARELIVKKQMEREKYRARHSPRKRNAGDREHNRLPSPPRSAEDEDGRRISAREFREKQANRRVLTSPQRTSSDKQTTSPRRRNNNTGRDLPDLLGVNEKLDRLYDWHMLEIDLVAKQQRQLNDVSGRLHSLMDQARRGNGEMTFANISPSSSTIRGEDLRREVEAINELSMKALEDSTFHDSVTLPQLRPLAPSGSPLSPRPSPSIFLLKGRVQQWELEARHQLDCVMMALDRLLSMSISMEERRPEDDPLEAFKRKLADLGIEPDGDAVKAYPDIPREVLDKSSDLTAAVVSSQETIQGLSVAKGALFALVVIMESSTGPFGADDQVALLRGMIANSDLGERLNFENAATASADPSSANRGQVDESVHATPSIDGSRVSQNMNAEITKPDEKALRKDDDDEEEAPLNSETQGTSEAAVTPPLHPTAGGGVSLPEDMLPSEANKVAFADNVSVSSSVWSVEAQASVAGKHHHSGTTPLVEAHSHIINAGLDIVQHRDTAESKSPMLSSKESADDESSSKEVSASILESSIANNAADGNRSGAKSEKVTSEFTAPLQASSREGKETVSCSQEGASASRKPAFPRKENKAVTFSDSEISRSGTPASSSMASRDDNDGAAGISNDDDAATADSFQENDSEGDGAKDERPTPVDGAPLSFDERLDQVSYCF